MRKLLTFLLFTLGILSIFRCNNSPKETNPRDIPMGDGGMVVVDDLDPGFRSIPLILDTIRIDSSATFIIRKDGITKCNIQKDATNAIFTLNEEVGNKMELQFTAQLDSAFMSKVDVYYSLPAIMNSKDTILVLMPRSLLVAEKEAKLLSSASDEKN